MRLKRVEKLGQMVSAESEAAEPQSEATKPEVAPAKPKADKRAKGRAQAPKGAPVKAKASKKATRAKSAPKAKKGAKTEQSAGPRGGSKMAEVVAMMQRKGGATITDIMSGRGAAVA